MIKDLLTVHTGSHRVLKLLCFAGEGAPRSECSPPPVRGPEQRRAGVTTPTWPLACWALREAALDLSHDFTW